MLVLLGVGVGVGAGVVVVVDDDGGRGGGVGVAGVAIIVCVDVDVIGAVIDVGVGLLMLPRLQSPRRFPISPPPSRWHRPSWLAPRLSPSSNNTPPTPPYPTRTMLWEPA